MKKITFGDHENIARNIIAVDGISRTGKTMLNSIIPSLDCVEHTKNLTFLEHIVPALSMGAINPEFAKVFVRMALNETAYNEHIGRNVNFRYDDLTGIFNYKEPEIYFKRLMKQDGDEIIEELRKSKSFIPIITHEILVNLEFFNLLGIDYFMLALFRNPLDTIYSWWKRGWGERFGTDPRAFTLTIEHSGLQLPWYCLGSEEEWLSLNSVERCAHTVIDLNERAVKQYKKSVKKEQIHLLTFEDFAQNPYGELERICLFLGTEKTIHTPRFVSLAKCPRELDPSDRKRKWSEVKAQAKKELFEKIIEMSELYEANLYGLL
ncbi:MAG: hypothetical protein CMI55_02690 [Parcubacteria group bacterium]|jgi:hypothetical protein|nr:hypothetical protein [Parcubacteria group bacterium]|tara:strand:- start:177 stop:1139 length:963 start_codon:yes stop_codon:yes gene_type:complete